MRGHSDLGETYRIIGVSMVVGALVIFAIFFAGRPKDPSLQDPSVQMMPQGNCLMNPNSPGCPRAMAMQTQPGQAAPTMPAGNCLMYPYSPGCPRAQLGASVPQAGAVPVAVPVAFQSGSLTLPMGVTLAGRGTVVSVEPGSMADRAGIQVGDLINRINGR